MPRPYASSVLDATADDVWALVRDFGALADWHPAIDTCEIEPGPPNHQVGAVRRLTNQAGVIRERLVALDDGARSQTYEFVENPFGVRRYVATVRVFPVTDTGKAFAEWYADFDAEGDAAAADQLIGLFQDGVFAGGLKAVAERLAK